MKKRPTWYPTGSEVKVRTMADQLEPMRVAWEEAGHRGAVLDALRRCLDNAPRPGGRRERQSAPLPEWLASVVEDVVTSWSRDAPKGTRGGRHARHATRRRDAVQDLDRYHVYTLVMDEKKLGLNPAEACAFVARWCYGDDPDERHAKTIEKSIERAKTMPPGARYLAMDDRVQMNRFWRDKAAQARWIALWQEYRSRKVPAEK